MKQTTYPLQQQVRLTDEADVMVVGGGPGGLGAAVMAARAGARTILFERYGFLGGMAVAGEVHPFMPNHAKGACLDKPVYLEWVERMRAYLPPDHPMRTVNDTEAHSAPARMLSKDAAMLAAEDLCLAAGVTLRYHHTLADAIVEGDRIEAAIFHSKTGFTAARAAMFIDATGDADLAARSGCRCEEGGPSGHCQPMTLCFKLAGVDLARMPPRADLQRLYDEAKARGDIRCLRENVLWFKWYEPDVAHFNTTRVVQHRATNGVELSNAEIDARRQLREILAFLRARVAGFEQARLHSVAHHIGVRESRRVIGRAYLERPAFGSAAKFDDAIARVSYPIDIHSTTGSGTEIATLPDGEWYEIPYGCIVAADRDNLLIAGRPISVDHAIHSSMRVMPPAISVGQAAGMAAAMAVKRHVTPAALDGREVRTALRQAGANL
jgi:hypothetical protein